MTEEKLSRANKLSNFIESYKIIIEKYYNGMSTNDSNLGRALIDIDKYAPKESTAIKNALKNALNSIQKEFDEL